MDSRQFRKSLLTDLKEIGITPKVTEKLVRPQYIAYLNTLRGMKGLMQTIRQEFSEYDKVDITEVWMKSEQTEIETPFGTASYDKVEVLNAEPIVGVDYMHLVAVQCDDENLLKYVEWTIEKYLSEYSELKPVMDGVYGIRKTQPSLKSLETKDVSSYIKELFSNIKV